VRLNVKRASEAASETDSPNAGMRTGGELSCSAQCDAWALGVTLLVLLTGPPPPLNSDQCKQDSVWLNMQKGKVRAAPPIPGGDAVVAALQLWRGGCRQPPHLCVSSPPDASPRHWVRSVHILRCRCSPQLAAVCDDCGRCCCPWG
jgi:hypothetical protein